MRSSYAGRTRSPLRSPCRAVVALGCGRRCGLTSAYSEAAASSGRTGMQVCAVYIGARRVRRRAPNFARSPARVLLEDVRGTAVEAAFALLAVGVHAGFGGERYGRRCAPFAQMLAPGGSA